MAWVAPYTFVAGVLTADDLNAMLRDNMNETAPAKARQRNSYFSSTGANALAERRMIQKSANGQINISSSSYVTAADGPSLTVQHSGSLLAMWSCRMFVSSGVDRNNPASCSVSLEGQQSGLDRWAARHPGDRADINRVSSYNLFTGLPPGESTVTLVYRVSSGSANFAQRQLIVMPF